VGRGTGPLEGLGLLMEELGFYMGKRVLVTGHTGFKGAWMCQALADAGAIVTGYALDPPTEPNLFSLCGLKSRMDSVIGDVRDLERLSQAFHRAQPEIVIHLAAQPIVRTGYEQPVYTYETNVMGTVHVLECVRAARQTVKSVVIVTTDKVYENREWTWGYRENEPLDGYDPYSNSKSCAELVTHSYKNSFFSHSGPAVSTARAGNVIGGGDFARDRIIPDCVRAAAAGKPVVLRNPNSIRPYQHVLEPVMAYLMLARRQYENPKLAGWYNVGPDEQDCVTTGELARLFCRAWGCGMSWAAQGDEGPHEAQYLKLDCSKLRAVFGWRPRWHIQKAVEQTVEWSRVWLDGGDIAGVMRRQIAAYLEG